MSNRIRETLGSSFKSHYERKVVGIIADMFEKFDMPDPHIIHSDTSKMAIIEWVHKDLRANITLSDGDSWISMDFLILEIDEREHFTHRHGYGFQKKIRELDATFTPTLHEFINSVYNYIIKGNHP